MNFILPALLLLGTLCSIFPASVAHAKFDPRFSPPVEAKAPDKFGKGTPWLDDSEVENPFLHYSNFHKSFNRGFGWDFFGNSSSKPPQKSDLKTAFSFQTPVKSQESRPACSHFAFLGALEYLLKRNQRGEFDFSENFLILLIASRLHGDGQITSSAPENTHAIQTYGLIEEPLWPYEKYDWLNPETPYIERIQGKRFCEGLSGSQFNACLGSHLLPSDTRFDAPALQLKEKLRLDQIQIKKITRKKEIKINISQNLPVILTIDFFYKAWNHGRMEKLGLGTPDITLWLRGEVQNPTRKDILKSKQRPTAHAIVLVGYDDDKEVYYFKNSWGTDAFGAIFELPETGKVPGFGSIPYEYAHKYGHFYSLDFEEP